MITNTHRHQLELATDADGMRERLERIIQPADSDEIRIEALDIPRVLPRPSGEILIQYQLTLCLSNASETSDQIIYGEYFPARPPSRTDVTDGARVVWIDDLNLRIWLFPSDPRLERLPVLFDALRFHRMFGDNLENVGQGGCSDTIQTQVLGYRIGRRCTALISWTPEKEDSSATSRREVIVKLSRRKQALALWTKLRQLELAGFDIHADDQIVLPKHLFLHQRAGAIFQRRESGKSLHEQTGSELFADGCMAAARALEKLHHVHLTGLPARTVADEISHLEWLTGLTGETYPSLRMGLRSALADLRSDAPTDDTGLHLVSHRDFYDKQILFDGTRTVLLDYDTLAMADPALDFGNFIAHLEWRVHQMPVQQHTIDNGREAFRATYTAPDPGFEKRALWWTRATRLRLVCLYTWRPRWRESAPALLDMPSTEQGVRASS